MACVPSIINRLCLLPKRYVWGIGESPHPVSNNFTNKIINSQPKRVQSAVPAQSQKKVEAKTADKVVKKLEKTEKKQAKTAARSALAGVKGGRLSQRKQYSQSLALARYMAMLVDPSVENCCRAPESETMRETFVFCLKESGTCTSSSGGRISFTINNDPRACLTFLSGGSTWGIDQLNSVSEREHRFTAWLDILPLARIGRLNAIRYRLRSILNAYDVKGFWADAPYPNDGSELPTDYEPSAVSALPNSICGNVVANAEISAFLLPAGNGGQVSTPGGVIPMEFYSPFEWRYLEGEFDAVTYGNNDSHGCRHIFSASGLPVSTACFQIEIEACYEVQPLSQVLLQVAATGSLRPPPGSEEVIGDLMENVRPDFAGASYVAPPTVAAGIPNLSGNQTIGPKSKVTPTEMVETMADKANDGVDLTSSVLGMVDDLVPDLGTVASHAFDLAEEYGPDLLTAVGGLIPGGGDLGLAAKYGGKALKWMLGK